jgi:hypothetical protein
MAEVNATDATPVATATSGGSSFFKRELNGSTFLSLEHALHMVLVVVVAGLVCAGVITAISLWTSSSGVMSGLGVLPAIGGAAAKYIEANAAVGLVASLVVLVPALVILDRRTRAEWLKRPGYTNRVAYKVPIYLALGVLIAVKVAAVIQMLTVILTSLSVIGVNGYAIGDMYMNQFLPAAISAIIFGASAWYLFKLAKGRDNGKMFSTLVMVLSVILVLALFITSVVTLRNNGSAIAPSDYFKNYDGSSDDSSRDLEDIFRY